MLRFNPHTREGVTRYCSGDRVDRVGFNPHTREGVTRPMEKVLRPSGCFNPHTREGVTFFHLGKIEF